MMLQVLITYQTAGGRTVPLAGSVDAPFVRQVIRSLIQQARRRAEELGDTGLLGEIEREEAERLFVTLGPLLAGDLEEQETLQ